MADTLKTNAFFRGFTDKSLTAMIAVGFLEHNPLPAAEVPGFITSIHATLAALPPDADIVVDKIGAAAAQTANAVKEVGVAAETSQGEALAGAGAADPFPGTGAGPAETGATVETPQFDGSEHKTASEIKKSITNGGLISFIDGQAYQTIKRHLTKHGMTPETYRARFGLPDDYPMTAPNYAAERRALALKQGLGGGRPAPAQEPTAAETPTRGATARRTPQTADKGRNRRSGAARAAHAGT